MYYSTHFSSADFENENRNEDFGVVFFFFCVTIVLPMSYLSNTYVQTEIKRHYFFC